MNKPANTFGFVLILFYFAVSLSACSPKISLPESKLKKKTAKFILEATKNNQLQYNWISSKMSCSASIDGKNADLNIKLRLRKDSAIWMSISPALGIEMARVLITPDSLKYVNRLEKTYYTGSVLHLNSLSPAKINFQILQNLIVGTQNIKTDKKQTDNHGKFKASIENQMYLLSSINKKAHQKSMEGKKIKDNDGVFYWVLPNTFKVHRIEETNYSKKQKIIIEHDKYEPIKGQEFPMSTKLFFEDTKPLTITIEHSRVEMNNPLKLPFSISSKYEPIY